MVSNQTIELIKDAVQRYEAAVRPTRIVVISFTLLIAIFALSVMISYHLSGNLEKATAPGSAVFTLIVFVYTRLRSIDACIWEANMLVIVASAGGHKKLLADLENISCKKLSASIYSLKSGDGNG